MKIQLLRRFLAGMVLLAPATVLGVNLISSLSQSAFERFNDDDLDLFQTTMQEVLETLPDGESRDWKNEETGHGGSFTAVRTSEGAAGPCRELRIINYAGDRRGQSTFTFCRQSDQTWMIDQPK